MLGANLAAPLERSRSTLYALPVAMWAQLSQWLELGLRWAHVISAITWIGHALFFNWLEASLEKSDQEGVQGEAWLLHGGGFYQVAKRPEVASALLSRLHWFKWEAAATWLTGVALLASVYYAHGGIYLVAAESPLGYGAACAVGIGSLIAGWAAYDALWSTPLARSPALGAAISFALLVGAAFGLSQVISGRAAYLHVGAIMGTIMVANVWMRIIPAQRQLVAAIRAGGAPDQTLALRAKTRSRHNNYMTYPLIFIMISNHYFITHGDRWNWLLLALVMLAGAAVRHQMNRRRVSLLSAGAVVAAVAAAVIMTRPTPPKGRAKPTAAGNPVTSRANGDASITARAQAHGSLRGRVTYAGSIPAPRELSVEAGCAADGRPVTEQPLSGRDGGLANAIVWITGELADANSDPPPDQPVELDQAGCMYRPRVLAVQVDQPVAILNSDHLLHNIHSHADTNPSFNLAMPPGVAPIRRAFAEAEVVTMKCDVHPWMRAYIGVMPNSWFTITDERGTFAFDHLPTGQHRLHVWHETQGGQELDVTIAPSATAELSIAMDAPR